jgi:hypothetical protein
MNGVPQPRVVLLMAAIGVAWLGWNMFLPPGPDVCLFKAVTHLPCPSCGASRAALLFFRGDFAGSMRMNPIGPVELVVGAFLVGWMLVDTYRRRRSLGTALAEGERLLARHWPVFAGILACNWIWNIVKGN